MTVLNAIEPVIFDFELTYLRSTGRQPRLAELATSDSDTLDDNIGGEGIMCLRFECDAFPRRIKVESVNLIREVCGTMT